MNLEDAIIHCEEVAEKNEKKASWFWGKEGNPNYENCVECAEEHRQLAEWLKELKECRRHTGYWVLINRGLDLYMCDRCGEILQIDSVPIWDYCPVCGARMEGETDGRPNQQTSGD